jgi:hypothetical protein
VNVLANAAGTLTNTTHAVTSNEGGTGGTASASLTVIAGNSLLTGGPTNNPALRNNYGNFVGMEFTVGNAALSASQLGRWCVAGNTGTHTVELVSAATGTVLPGGSVTVNMAGCTAGQYQYVAMAAPITLLANTSYYLASLEVNGGDQWYDAGTITPANVATVPHAVYFNGTQWLSGAGANKSYVPPNLLYSFVPPGVLPPTIGVAFAPATIVEGGASTMSFTIANPNTVNQLTGVGFTDTLPNGMLVATPSGLSGFCTGGTFTAVPGSGSVSLTGATLVAGASCNYSLNVVASVTGTLTNTTGAVTSNEGGAGGTASASLTVTAGSGLLTGGPTSNPALRNNYGNFVGMEFTVGNTALSVGQLGRMCVAGNTGSHSVKLVNAATGTDLPGGAVTVNMAGCTAGQYQYAPLAVSLTLSANTSYYLASLEVNGGDQWYDAGTITPANVATVPNAVYFNGTQWANGAGANKSYVPPNLLYTH